MQDTELHSFPLIPIKPWLYLTQLEEQGKNLVMHVKTSLKHNSDIIQPAAKPNKVREEELNQSFALMKVENPTSIKVLSHDQQVDVEIMEIEPVAIVRNQFIYLKR